MATYKLIYLDALSRGECPRLMFKTAGIEFEDFRISEEQWPEFQKTILHGMVPVLEVNGKRIIQSLAICRYIAREAGFYGSNNWESTRIDSICENIVDYEHDVDRLWQPHDSDEIKATLKKRYVEEKIPKIYGILETLLKENNDGNNFFVGEKISMADFYVFAFIDGTVRTHYPSNYDPKDFPKLAAHMERMKKIPQVKDWLETRPDTPY
ncbi:probable glutathione S-transferase 5 [Apostichopus japonicus]|uniref:probable glutathione S-transferase 5 n=1 Tax=Stichopus japonicus TaxID=307972 RepID=UPI003AB22EE1